ncbi:Svep1 [Scenedesmus sp. PABB004]|nr:Svep1 [Scenedesmus sp. PABB004]
MAPRAPKLLLTGALLLLLALGGAAAQPKGCGLNAKKKGGKCVCNKDTALVPKTRDCCPAHSVVLGTGKNRKCTCKRGYVFSAAAKKCRTAAASSNIPEVYALTTRFESMAEAADACRNVTAGTVLATVEQMKGALSAGADWCTWGYTADLSPEGLPVLAYPGGNCSATKGVEAGVQTTTTPEGAAWGVCYGVKPFQGTPSVRPFNEEMWTQWVCLFGAIPDPPAGNSWPSTCRYTPIGGTCTANCAGNGAGQFFTACTGGTWSPVVGNCEITFCAGNPPQPANGNFSCAASSAIGANCTAACNENAVGTPTSVCQADGTWGPVKGNCVRGCNAQELPEAPGNSTWPLAQCNNVASGGTCKAECGFGFVGGPTITCGTDGAWVASSLKGTCRLSTAPCTDAPPALKNGVFNCGASTPHGSNCNGTCNPSFFGDPVGTPLIECRAGEWSGVVGECVEGCVSGELPAAPPNSRWETTCKDVRTGTVCSAKCDNGYTGVPFTVCTGPDKFADVSGECVKLPPGCTGNPPKPANGDFECGPFTQANLECVASCKPGFSGSPKATCGADSKWGAVTGTCVSSTTACTGSPPNPENGAFSCGASTPVAGECSAACAAGFVFDSTDDLSYNATGPWSRCGSDGKWGQLVGKCVKAVSTCPGSPGKVGNGTFACGASTAVGANCTATCNAGFFGKPAALCEAGGIWGEVVGGCTAGCLSSKLPPPPANGTWIGSCSTGVTSVGGVCNVDCEPGFVGTPVSSCEAGGVWSALEGTCAPAP